MNWIDIFDPNFQYPPLRKHLGRLRVLFSGTPRGGTKFLADLLRRLNVPCVGHEVVFQSQGPNDGAWNLETEVSGFAWPYGNIPGVQIYHVTRHPVQTINSMVDYFPYLFKERESWKKAELFWYRTFRFTEYALKIEEFPMWLPDVLWQAYGLQTGADEVRKAAEGVKSNTCKLPRKSNVTWEDLSVRTQDLARSLGYRV